MKNYSIRLVSPKYSENTWQIAFRSFKKYHGLTDHHARKILLDKQSDFWSLISVAIHEATHASVPDLSEDAVLRIEENCMSILKPILEPLLEAKRGS